MQVTDRLHRLDLYNYPTHLFHTLGRSVILVEACIYMTWAYKTMSI